MEDKKNILVGLLYKKYDKLILSKKEVTNELGISESKLDYLMSNDKDKIPLFFKFGDKKNSKVGFSIIDVSNFLA